MGPEHTDVATSLNNLALLYQAMREYAKAEPLYQRVPAIEDILGQMGAAFGASYRCLSYFRRWFVTIRRR